MAHPALATTAHRPWPLPPAPHVMQMDWEELLFAHWPVPARVLRDHIPPQLELEQFEGEAFLGLVPFRMNRVRPRVTPALPGTACFPELNVRTYVRHGERPGVWFFSLDAASWLSVRLARVGFGLPYFDARMGIEVGERGVVFRSRRVQRGAWPAEFVGEYRPTGPVSLAQPGTLEAFLVERYCLYSLRRGRLMRGEVAHPPWPLQPAEAELRVNTMASLLQCRLAGPPPLLHYSKVLATVAWAPKVVS